MQKSLILGTTIGIFGLVNAAQAASLGDDYTAMKNYLSKTYGLEYNLNYSLLAQHGAPSGRYNPVQSYLSPSITWTTFDNHYGTGVLNASYTSVFYGRHNANDVENRIGTATPINDADDNEQEFSTLYYTYQLPHQYNWLTLGLGQYTIYNFSMISKANYNSFLGAYMLEYLTWGRNVLHKKSFSIEKSRRKKLLKLILE